MLYSTHNRRRIGARQRGVSLVEVLVALVLLVVGIYSIARLFPGGFFSLRSAQNSDIADRLAQGQLEQLKQDNNFLLDAVYMYSDQVGFFSDSSSVSPTASGTYTPTGGTPDPTLADIDRARYISGETFTVPAPNTAANVPTNGVSVHVLNDGPVVVNAAGGLAEPAPLAATPSPTQASPLGVYGLPPVHSGPWTAKLGSAPQGYNNAPVGNQYYDTGNNAVGNFDLPSDLLAAGGPIYAVDYTNEQIAIPPATYDQSFTLQLKVAYPASGTGTSATPAETVTFYIPLLLHASNGTTTPYGGLWFNPQTATAAMDSTRPVVTNVPPPSNVTPTGWVPGSAVLTRTMRTDSTLAALQADPDPYSYLVYSSDTSLTGVNLGTLAINPKLQGQAVSVSYLTYDWHIIREDVDNPGYNADGTTSSTNTPSPIHLTLDHLKRVGDVQDDQSINPGLFRTADLAAGAAGYDIVILDTDTGQSIGLTAPAAGATGTPSVFDLDNAASGTAAAAGQFTVSYQNGYVTLPYGVGTTMPDTTAWASVPHQHVRIFYAGDYDWAVALQKNPGLYSLYPATPPEKEPYLVPPLALSQVPLPNEGQYVEVVFVSNGPDLHLHFPVSDLGQTVSVHHITYVDTSGNTQQIPDVTGATITTDYSDSNYIDLGQMPNFDTNRGTVTIETVQGISARSVVIWKERGQWKSRSDNTILTQ